MRSTMGTVAASAVALAAVLAGCTGGAPADSGSGGDATSIRYLIEQPEDPATLSKLKAHIAEFERKVLPQARALAQRVSYFVTEEQPNNFVRLPVREGEFAFVVTGICEDAGALEAWQKLFPQGETLWLQPAARALYR